MQDEHILLYKDYSRNDIIQWHLIIKGQPFWRFPEPSLYPCKSPRVLKTAGELCSSGRRLFTASLPGELGENDCFDWELIWISYEFLFGSVGNAKCRRLQAYPSLMRHSWKSILLRSITRTRKHLASTFRAPLNYHDLIVQSVGLTRGVCRVLQSHRCYVATGPDI